MRIVQEAITPMMRQYLQIKASNKDAIVFFRLGDFYEMFFEDAIEATKILHITLTSRGTNNGQKIPMCGIPHHAAENYISRLVKAGKKIAICEQIEKPTPGKKLVDREVVKIITPGTFIPNTNADDIINNYIVSINWDDSVYGLAYADISTGEFKVTEIQDESELITEIFKISPSECVFKTSASGDAKFKKFTNLKLGACTFEEDWHYDYELSLKEIKNHFGVDRLEGYGCENMPVAIGATGALIKYLKNTQKTKLNNINDISTYRTNQFMAMDRTSHRHLELLQNQEDLSTDGTLFGILDKTRTSMGRRKLKNWIINPLLDVIKIKKRLNIVEYFVRNINICQKVREILGEMYDIERLSNKVSLGSANARDMVSLGESLKKIERVKDVLTGEMPEELNKKIKNLDSVKDVIEKIENCLAENPPVSIRDGFLVKDGYSSLVDEFRVLISSGKDWVTSLQKTEIEKTGINSLKVGYNKVFGYYIEVTNANLNLVPETYIRKQTLVNAERFITEELKEKEAKIIGAVDKIKTLEYDIFCELREDIAKEINRLKKISNIVSEVDVLSNLGEVAIQNKYVLPEVNEGDILDITGARHPVIEKLLKDKEFVPNDTYMDTDENKIFIITGSNMAGKSTYIRQIALIIVMAQMGSFVPCERAKIGIVDRIFTRVGASDKLYHGMSTFMVEMLETANILNNATSRSLIILDEIGRGTSTFDGVSIAWAVVEYLHNNLPLAKAMFATHYHELTELSEIMRGVKNYHLRVQELGEDIVFLYRVKEGSCDESFGIHVAKLAGMPKEVVRRAKNILENLQKDSLLGNIKTKFIEKKDSNEKQLDFFSGDKRDHPVINKIKDMNIDNISPIEALNLLNKLKNEVE